MSLSSLTVCPRLAYCLASKRRLAGLVHQGQQSVDRAVHDRCHLLRTGHVLEPPLDDLATFGQATTNPLRQQVAFIGHQPLVPPALDVLPRRPLIRTHLLDTHGQLPRRRRRLRLLPATSWGIVSGSVAESAQLSTTNLLTQHQSRATAACGGSRSSNRPTSCDSRPRGGGPPRCPCPITARTRTRHRGSGRRTPVRTTRTPTAPPSHRCAGRSAPTRRSRRSSLGRPVPAGETGVRRGDVRPRRGPVSKLRRSRQGEKGGYRGCRASPLAVVPARSPRPRTRRVRGSGARTRSSSAGHAGSSRSTSGSRTTPATSRRRGGRVP